VTRYLNQATVAPIVYVHLSHIGLNIVVENMNKLTV